MDALAALFNFQSRFPTRPYQTLLHLPGWDIETQAARGGMTYFVKW